MPMKNSAGLSMSLVINLFGYFLLVNGNIFEKKYDEEEGRIYLKKINADIQVKTTESVLASWAYESNITDENLRNQLEVSAKLANYTKEIWKETIKYPWKTFKDPDVRRQFQKFSVLGTAILSPPKYERFNKIISDMQSVYGKAKICNYHNRTNCTLQLEPELTEIFVKSRDPDELRYYWEQWRNVAGKPVRNMYKEYVALSNEAAVLNNFTNNAEFWLKDYEAKDFKNQVEVLWQQLKPLYLQLHAYVRRRLREQYGEKHVTKRGPIPAHLLGNMWAQSWGNIFDFTTPYPGKPSMDVTPNMVEQGFTPLRMFKLAEEFFTSLNLSPMPDTFWKNSILDKPKDGRDLICHASAWDFYDGKDFRIKQCTRITMEDLNTVHHEMGHIQYFLQYKNQPLVYKEGTNPGRIIDAPTEKILLIKQCTRVTFRQLVTVHHEMGHIQYYLQYKNQPKIYRRGANPGFHEAVGDVMALSVSTPKHLRKIGLLNATEDDDESEINQLFNMALDKIAFLPFGYLMDQWRWSVFEGTTNERDYNCKWWQLREKYQGLSPSVIRTEDDFDPGAKYHTVGNVPYIRYFVSFVIQFQFHRSLCIAAKEFDPNDPTSKPLHKCDIYQSKEAGALLKKMLQMGSSKPWPDAMEVMTGQRNMDARALLDYFATLQAWLEKENKRTGEFIGWESSQRECVLEEQEETQPAKPLDTHGNFEDDNIAYSYAEFVRQDDNSFGFPDYLEEIQPSYHSLRHRLKKKEFQSEYFLPKRKTRKFYKEGNTYLPENLYLQDENKYVDFSSSEHCNGRLKHKPVEKIQSLGFPNPANYDMYKVSPHKVHNKQTKDQDKKKHDLLNEILKEVQYLKSNKEFDGASLANKKRYKWILRRNAGKSKRIKVALTDKSSTTNEKKEKSDSLGDDNLKNDDLEEEEDQNTADNDKDHDSKSWDEKASNENKPDSNLAFFKKKISEHLDINVPNEILWKAELVKHEAEKMLKSFNLTNISTDLPSGEEYDDNLLETVSNNSTMNGTQQLKSQYPLKRMDNSKKIRNVLPMYNTLENFRPLKSAKVIFNPFENFLKTSGVGSLKNNPKLRTNLHFKEYDLVGVIPVEDYLVEGDSGKEWKEEKRSSKSSNPNKFSYVVLVGKLSEKEFPAVASEAKKQKKSYRKYQYNVKTPISYNAVVITPGGKNDKPDESRDHWAKVATGLTSLSQKKSINRDDEPSNLNENKRSRREFFKNEFSNSVKNNIFNINNIVQYFGCLQLLL